MSADAFELFIDGQWVEDFSGGHIEVRGKLAGIDVQVIIDSEGPDEGIRIYLDNDDVPALQFDKRGASMTLTGCLGRKE